MWGEMCLHRSSRARSVQNMVRIDPYAVAIGDAVRGAIAQAGLTQEEAAANAGLSTNTLSRRINGSLPFTWPEIVRLARITDTTPSELATRAERIATKKEPV